MKTLLPTSKVFYFLHILMILFAAASILMWVVRSGLPIVYAADPERTVRVGVYENKPKTYQDYRGMAVGLFPDILNYIAEKERWQLEYVFGTWDEGLRRLEKGEIDVMVDVAPSGERRAIFAFTNESVFSSWGVVYVQKEDVQTASFSDLDGKKIAILESSVYFDEPESIEDYIQAFGVNVEFVNVQEYNDVFELLNDGEVDAAVVGRIFALTNQKYYPNIKQTDIFFKPTELRFALTKDDSDTPQLIDRLDYWTKQLKAGHEGAYRQILDRYNLGGLTVSTVVSPWWIIPVEVAGAILLIVLLSYIFYLFRKSRMAIWSLRESEEKFSKVFEMAPYPIVIAQAEDGKCIEINDAFTTLTGYTRDEILTNPQMGKDLWVNKEDLNRVIDELRQGHTVINHECQIRVKNGEIRMGLFSAQVAKFGQKKYVYGRFVDITDQKKIIHKMHTLSQWYSNLLAAIPDIVMEVNKDKVYTWANQAGIEFFGNDVIGKEAAHYFEGDQQTYNVVQPLFQGKENTFYVESWQRRKDGKKRLLAWWCRSIKDEKGNVIGALSSARDITEEKQSKEALWESEEKFSKAFLTSPNAITITRAEDGMFIDVNRAFELLTGYTREEALSSSSISLRLWANLVDRDQMVRDLRAGRSVTAREYLFRTKSGEFRIGLFSAQILQLGQQPCILSSIADITEKKKAENEAKSSELRYRRLFEAAHDGILLIDFITGMIIDVNPFLVHLLGYPKEDFLKKHLWEVGVFKDVAASKENFLTLQQKKYVRFEDLPLETKDGKRVDVEFVANAYDVDGNTVIQCNIRDITERKATEQFIMDINTRDESILSSIGDAVVACDTQGTLVLFNKMAEEMTGVLAKDAIGRHYNSILAFVRESDGQPSGDFIAQSLSQNKTVAITDKLLLVRKDGKKIPIADSAAPIKSADGTVIGSVVVFHDVIQEREIDRVKTEFVSLASHQLRTPLTSIKWYVEMLQAGDVGELNDKQKEYLSEVYNGSLRTITLINDLLNISRLEEGRITIRPVPTNLTAFIHDVRKEVEMKIQDTGCEVVLDVPEDGEIVSIDKDLLRQVLVNFLVNAIVYSSVDKQGKVTLSYTATPDNYRISVTDNGIGIPQEVQHRIFEKFFRADNARKIIADGNGLGLYLAKQIMETAGGTIGFTSEVGKGSTFHITIPRVGMKAKEGEVGLEACSIR